MRQKLVKLLPVIAALLLQTGCTIWTGGMPASYAAASQYPVVASIHGIKEVSFTNGLNQIIITYIPTNVIALSTNTFHGFRIQIEPSKKPLLCQEYYILPKPARWGTKGEPVWGIISLDRTTCRKDDIIPPGVKYISDGWGMFPDDPLGEYQIAVFLDGKLAADFKFQVVDKSTISPVSADKPNNQSP